MFNCDVFDANISIDNFSHDFKRTKITISIRKTVLNALASFFIPGKQSQLGEGLFQQRYRIIQLKKKILSNAVSFAAYFYICLQIRADVVKSGQERRPCNRATAAGYIIRSRRSCRNNDCRIVCARVCHPRRAGGHYASVLCAGCLFGDRVAG